jgi:hypothetical protein
MARSDEFLREIGDKSKVALQFLLAHHLGCFIIIFST